MHMFVPQDGCFCMHTNRADQHVAIIFCLDHEHTNTN
jgi:hypothetical protein